MRALNGLMQFGQGSAPFHRLRVRGTVTYQSSGNGLYIQDGNLPLLIHAKAQQQLVPGTEIEAVGFASRSTYSPELQDAIFRVIGRATPIRPRLADVDEMSRKNASELFRPYDGPLVEIEGQVVERSESSIQRHFLLRQRMTLIPVTLEKTAAAVESLGLPGSTIRVTRICAALKDRNGDPESFEILARSAADFQLIAKPSCGMPSM